MNDEHFDKPESFRGCSIVACGTMRKEINALQEQGFLDADKVLFTTPGLHERNSELKNQVEKQVAKALETSKRVIVVYGGRCYIDNSDMSTIDKILSEFGPAVSRIDAVNCIDMLADRNQREALAAGRKVYWMPPGWMAFRKMVFYEWDDGRVNETFPMNAAAVILDSIGYFDHVMETDPEQIIEFSDWMKIPIEAVPIGLDRFKNLLRRQP